ncbi:glycosyltransferase [Rhizobium rhizogenes]|uniref:Glycosyltransferase protein n=1 Tax=Rhizobium rhizogenes (strain K84 / ATCC BAA-868) TaxID=311403 RepID=B9JPU1_RHIR8|nr:hypothetical protein Arad_12094 [Rhizobium rhizogenes K84]NTG77917.1 glycosyltransferase family 4 protein [Rhizobium rhizogenes]
MRVLSIANVSNIDNPECDSGIIFQRLIADELVNYGIQYDVLVPKTFSTAREYCGAANAVEFPLGTTRYESRFSFDWNEFKRVITLLKPDVIFNSQVELTSAIRALLVTEGKTIPIVSYCHYPALWAGDGQKPEKDASLDHAALWYPIVQDILSALNTADRFIIQSDFAGKLVAAAASFYNVPKHREIGVVAPPVDPAMLSDEPTEARLARRRNRKVIYNHRLYASYGTQDFIDHISECLDLNCRFFISDPMGNRSMHRAFLSGSPADYRQRLSAMPCVDVSPLGYSRAAYRGEILSSRVGIAAFRPACVWSMSALDCMGLGTPVIAPNYASYPEFIPPELLFNSVAEFRCLLVRLLEDDIFWCNASDQSRTMALRFSVQDSAARFFKMFSTLGDSACAV